MAIIIYEIVDKMANHQLEWMSQVQENKKQTLIKIGEYCKQNERRKKN